MQLAGRGAVVKRKRGGHLNDDGRDGVLGQTWLCLQTLRDDGLEELAHFRRFGRQGGEIGPSHQIRRQRVAGGALPCFLPVQGGDVERLGGALQRKRARHGFVCGKRRGRRHVGQGQRATGAGRVAKRQYGSEKTTEKRHG